GEGLESENLEGTGSKQQDPKNPAAGTEATKQTGGSTGTGSSTETVNVLLSTQSATASTTIATNTTAKVKILGVRVKGKLLNVILAIPAAGRITLTGADLVRVSRNLPKSQRLVLKVRLRRAGLAIISSHKKRSRITLRVLFKPREGVSSVASAVVKVR
ncbi:MAG: hypothetical protein ACRDK2_00530, partial [Solirubrobacteraceae bacterium]